MRERTFHSILDALDAASGSAADAQIDPQALALARERLAEAKRVLGNRVRASAYLAYAHHLADQPAGNPAPFAASA